MILPLQSIAGILRPHARTLGGIVGALLLFCCLVPRRTESYFRTDLPRRGDRPHNASPTDLPAPPGVESFVNSIGMRMIRLPAGAFVMGSPATEPGRGDDETQRELRLGRPFYISQTEVTQAEWNAIMEFNPSRFVGDRLPVQNIRMSDAWVFCDRLTAVDGRKYMPPTELEWEYACRAGALTPYNTGTTLGESQARFAVGGRAGAGPELGPRPVGSYPPNAWGLYDMHGNVAECCGDQYSPGNLLERIAGHFEPYLVLYDDAVFRGGSWESPAAACRSASRDHANRFAVQDTVGFRVIIVEE
jgi:formylglycine-generating enzyme required for sulfatase activity